MTKPQIQRPKVATTLGQPETWSTVAAITAVIVGTLVFAAGNISAFQVSPFLTVLVNGSFIYLMCVVAKFLAKFLSKRAKPDSIGKFLIAYIVVASALRGLVLDLLFAFIGYEDEQGVLLRAIWSLSVFMPGFFLSIIVVQFITKWRADEERIQELTNQRNDLMRTITAELDTYLGQITSMIKERLEPKIGQISNLSKTEIQGSLKDMVDTVIRPISHNLNQDSTNLVALRPMIQRVTLQDFNNRALQTQPLFPVTTGIIFGLLLLPRNLVYNTISTGIWVTVLVGTVIGIGNWLINLISKTYFRKLPGSVHFFLISVLLALLGASIATISQLITPQDLGYDQLHITGAFASLLLSLLVGGVINARRYFEQQLETRQYLEFDLQQELAKARQLQWQRSQTMSKWLHGPMQAALNSAAIRIGRVDDPAQFDTVRQEITHEVENMLQKMDQAETESADLATVIQRITDTWQDITQFDWQIAEPLPAMIANTPTETALSEVLTEAVFNAIKHASPDHISVSLAQTDNKTINLAVSHLGELRMTSDTGLGTRIYDNLTLRHSLTEAGGLVTFEAEFPVSLSSNSLN